MEAVVEQVLGQPAVVQAVVTQELVGQPGEQEVLVQPVLVQPVVTQELMRQPPAVQTMVVLQERVAQAAVVQAMVAQQAVSPQAAMGMQVLRKSVEVTGDANLLQQALLRQEQGRVPGWMARTALEKQVMKLWTKL